MLFRSRTRRRYRGDYGKGLHDSNRPFGLIHLKPKAPLKSALLIGNKKLNFLELHFQARTKALEHIVRELFTTNYLERQIEI